MTLAGILSRLPLTPVGPAYLKILMEEVTYV